MNDITGVIFAPTYSELTALATSPRYVFTTKTVFNKDVTIIPSAYGVIFTPPSVVIPKDSKGSDTFSMQADIPGEVKISYAISGSTDITLTSSPLVSTLSVTGMQVNLQIA